MDCQIAIKSYSLRLAVVYRPTPNKQNNLKTTSFLDNEWPAFLSQLATADKNIIIVRDFHFDKLENQDTVMIKSVLGSFGMRQHIAEPTHVAGHILDVVISRDTDDTLSVISDPGFPDSSGNISRDHFSVVFYARAAKSAPIRKTVPFRKLKSINISNLKADRRKHPKGTRICYTDTLVEIYNNELAAILDKRTFTD